MRFYGAFLEVSIDVVAGERSPGPIADIEDFEFLSLSCKAPDLEFSADGGGVIISRRLPEGEDGRPGPRKRE